MLADIVKIHIHINQPSFNLTIVGISKGGGDLKPEGEGECSG